MKFRRKSDAEKAQDTLDEETAATAAREALVGPYDAEDLSDDDGVERVDLGSLLIVPTADRELRMQVDEASGQVQSVMLAGPDGAVELRAFAAPRNGDLWSEVRPKIAADMAQRGGTATEREGRFGSELVCEIQVQRPEGNAVQNSRIIGINGSRWLLRATFLGKPARDVDSSDEWEDLLTQVAVRRGTSPMMVGEPLPLVLPESARRVQG
ncbi:DUF3710 domain-containing protein [Nocardioides sp.]|uniref:DUF3710 domain-containing protein n=1 Tax=Nocardioides sp. TaxID=35761 RepID=UPI00271C3043|nr:DUF3710 domain-containing protein [Nocardioides sp.]MDO9456531.1 DUF3710 domain-containing protein [Nocardioides sp.]